MTDGCDHVAVRERADELGPQGGAVRFPDDMLYGEVLIEANDLIARDTYRLRFCWPTMAERFLPGQFLMLRIPNRDDPLLGRAFALYDTVLDQQQRPSGVEIVYLVKGKATYQLSQLSPGYPLAVWGPLGNGFPPIVADHVVMVAGGIGQTPFLAWARELSGTRRFGCPPRTVPLVPRRTLCYGTRTAALLAGLDAFREAGLELLLATEDGTCGHRGYVTDLVQRLLDEGQRPHLVACGPDPMMAVVAQLAERYDVPCHVSLETPMACGMGICFSCVTRVKIGTSWDYRRTCVEGPVFDARQLVW